MMFTLNHHQHNIWEDCGGVADRQGDNHKTAAAGKQMDLADQGG